MIHVHTSSFDVDFNSKKFNGWTFKFPEKSIFWKNHCKISEKLLALHETGEEVHVITLSGYIFWSLVEQGLTRGTLKRQDLIMHYHLSDEVDNVSYLGPNLEMSAIYGGAHWEGGHHLANVRNMMGFYKGDQVNKFTFDDFYKEKTDAR